MGKDIFFLNTVIIYFPFFLGIRIAKELYKVNPHPFYFLTFLFAKKNIKWGWGSLYRDFLRQKGSITVSLGNESKIFFTFRTILKCLDLLLDNDAETFFIFHFPFFFKMY